MFSIICGIKDNSYEKRNKETKVSEGYVIRVSVSFLDESDDSNASVGQIPKTVDASIEDFGRAVGKAYNMPYDKTMLKQYLMNFINRPCIVTTENREFNGQITGVSLQKVYFIDELSALSSKQSNDLSKK